MLAGLFSKETWLAEKKLVMEESWLRETGFDEVFVMQLASDDKWWFRLKDEIMRVG